MLKAADALHLARYQVRVVSTRSTDWATTADEDVRRTRNWPWSVVDYHRTSAWSRYVWSGLRYHAARRIAKAFGAGSGPFPLLTRAYARISPELVNAIAAQRCDLVYGGQTGALAAVAVAARRLGIPYALDLEDFHSAEMDDGPGSRFTHTLAEQIERRILPGACFLTAGSAAIADAYTEKYGVRPIPINNTFPLPSCAPEISVSAGSELKLYWFSQTIGPGRGLEDAIRAMGLAHIPGQLHLRGESTDGYLATLQRLAADCAPGLTVVAHEPSPPDSMVDMCRGYDIGLCLEQTHVFNRTICLTNKAFTYMLGGLALVLTDTPGQRPIVDDLAPHVIAYPPGDLTALATGLKSWATNRDKLLQAKVAAWQAAQRRWHWEHSLERGALLDAVAGAIGLPTNPKGTAAMAEKVSSLTCKIP
ncbi:MAG TPA: glycosyltransferase [Pirellulales bacterium]|nr:glycosyltransferase [Pirellulales bacterium]